MSDKRRDLDELGASLELTTAQHSRLDRVAESVPDTRVLRAEFIDGQLCPVMQADESGPEVRVTPKGSVEYAERTKGVL